METNANQTKKESTNKFNTWVVGIILVNIIFGGIKTIIQCQTVFLFDPKLGIILLGIQLVGLISLIGILNAKKWAFFVWFAYRLAGAVINGYFDPIHGYSYHLLVAAGSILLLYITLQIKKNGIAAWDVIYRKSRVSDKNNESFDKNSNRQPEKKTVENTSETLVTDNEPEKLQNNGIDAKQFIEKGNSYNKETSITKTPITATQSYGKPYNKTSYTPKKVKKRKKQQQKKEFENWQMADISSNRHINIFSCMAGNVVFSSFTRASTRRG